MSQSDDPFDLLIAAADREIAARTAITARNKPGAVPETLPGWYTPHQWHPTALILEISKLECALCRHTVNQLPAGLYVEQSQANPRMGRRLSPVRSLADARAANLPLRREPGPVLTCICLSCESLLMESTHASSPESEPARKAAYQPPAGASCPPEATVLYRAFALRGAERGPLEFHRAGDCGEARASEA